MTLEFGSALTSPSFLTLLQQSPSEIIYGKIFFVQIQVVTKLLNLVFSICLRGLVAKTATYWEGLVAHWPNLKLKLS